MRAEAVICSVRCVPCSAPRSTLTQQPTVFGHDFRPNFYCPTATPGAIVRDAERNSNGLNWVGTPAPIVLTASSKPPPPGSVSTRAGTALLHGSVVGGLG